MSENAPESAGNIVKFQISSNFTDYAVELSAGVVDFRYYENVLALLAGEVGSLHGLY